jgi:alpha-1,3/alpha-1,6-mannosyltransferase
VPLFRLLYPKAKVLFYGHFPDRLLAQNETGIVGFAKSLYRQPFNGLEGWSTSCADSIVVNSKFTRAVFKYTFLDIKDRELKVIYPCVDTHSSKTQQPSAKLWPSKIVLLSINRFERKKSLDRAIRAYAGFSPEERSKSKLVIAGGFDDRVSENAQTLKSLRALADDLDLTHSTFQGTDESLEKDESNIVFLLSIPDELKRRLLSTAKLLIYTPSNEHFGIVPLEAMLASVPVLATNSGGPLETIYDGRTGWLRSPKKIEQWTDVMRKPLIPSSSESLKAMGEKGRERVLAEFSHEGMTNALDDEVQKLSSSTAKRPRIAPEWLYVLVFLLAFALVIGLVASFITFSAIERVRQREATQNATNSAIISSGQHTEL